VDQESVLGGIDIRHAGMAPLIVQVGRGDVADELAEGSFGVDGIVGIDGSHPWTRFGDAVELDIFRSLAVRAQVGTGPARRHVGESFSASRPGYDGSCDPYGQASHEASARNDRCCR